jgi:hypothetical protein
MKTRQLFTAIFISILPGCSVAKKGDNDEARIIYPGSCPGISTQTKTMIATLADHINHAAVPDTLLSDFKTLGILKKKLNAEFREYSSLGSKAGIDSCAKEIETVMPFLKMVWSEEGTAPVFTFHNGNLLRKAKQTKGESDDQLFELLNETWSAYGENMITFPEWLKPVTDLSGYSKLGDGIHTQLLKKIAALKKQNNVIIQEEADKLYGLVTDDLLSKNSYGNPRESVLKELQGIIDEKNLVSETDHQKLTERKKQLQTEKLQFDCKTGNCHFE